MYSNRFTHLENYEDIISNTNHIKKALKKLREIQKLEHKDNLTQLELEKISGKKKWERMIPNSNSDEKKQVKSKKKEKREKEKREKMEREQRERELKEEEERRKREEWIEQYKKRKANNVKELDAEWKFTVKNICDDDISKTFRLLSKKYHPDKNNNSENQELQKRLVYLRDLSVLTN